MSNQKTIPKMTGYKATNANMTCKGHKFELNQWSEVQGDLEMCKNGFHFCVHPSGVWSYYMDSTVRVFKCEAEDVLEVPTEAGADFKLVARRIRLTEEITPGMNGNDKSNTGHSNTGNWNTGHRNTGNWNTGHRNTGDRNTGDRNTGNWNTGNSNTGDSNTGNRNTGNWNTGNSNTGNWNTGNSNTGNWNTGNWNITNFCTGMFCAKEPKVISFDVQTKLTRDQYFDKYPEVYALGNALMGAAPIKFEDFKRIPGITKAKLKALHKAHLKSKKQN